MVLLPTQEQIIKYFDKITKSNENPKSYGKPLVANKKGSIQKTNIALGEYES